METCGDPIEVRLSVPHPGPTGGGMKKPAGEAGRGEADATSCVPPGLLEEGGEGVVGFGEGDHGGVDDAGADLADARFLVRDGRVDDRDEVLFHDFADVEAGGGAAEVEGGEAPKTDFPFSLSCATLPTESQPGFPHSPSFLTIFAGEALENPRKSDISLRQNGQNGM